MQSTSISTYALNTAPRLLINQVQAELGDRLQEVATGRHADVGLELGYGAGRVVAARADISLLQTIERSNAIAQSRLDLTQTALTDMEEVASDVLAAAIALPTGPQAAQTIAVEARAALDRLSDRLNASDGNSHLFGGINSDTAPFSRYDAGPEAAIVAAFTGRFGFAPGTAGAATITPAQMTDFLNNEFAALFDDPAWGTTWSSASDTNIVSRISPDERIVTSTNANRDAMRDLAEGFSLLAGLGIDALDEGTRQVVVDQARVVLGNGTANTTQLKARLGFSQNSISRADERMSLAQDLLTVAVADDEGVDPAEAKVRIDLITAQLEMSFALTGQIARLSILNFV
ncbi:MAG: flagellar hook-associated family protein [Pseudomonadota bacterium]